MKLVFCKSKNDGLWLIDRRLSSDKVVTDFIIDYAKENNGKLWISEYSSRMFKASGCDDFSIITEDSVFGENDVVFVEDLNPLNFLNKTKELVIIDWNRDYPATRKFKNNLDEFEKISENKIKGNSHDEIILQKLKKKGESNE